MSRGYSVHLLMSPSKGERHNFPVNPNVGCKASRHHRRTNLLRLYGESDGRMLSTNIGTWDDTFRSKMSSSGLGIALGI